MGEGAMPPLGFWDPFGLAEMGSDETLAWFRAAELKHGRVCMAAFSGWIVQSAGIHFPGAVDLSGTTFESLGKDPIAAWAALPDGGKWQILFAIGFLEFHSELAKPHVMRGGVPEILIHSLPQVCGILSASKGLSEKKKAIQRTKETANGRLAMIGMMGFFAAEAIPGSVPFVVF